MKTGAFFGYKCPRCGSKSDVTAVVGSDKAQCSCGAIMVPDPNGQTSTANAYCPNCKSFAGLVNSDRCPTCGGPFSRLP